MTLKQFLLQKLSLFFMLSTLISAAVCILGMCFDPDASFGYRELLTPLIYAACCTLPSLVTYSRRELRPGQLLLRRGLQLALTEAVMLYFAYDSPVIDTDNISVVLSIAGSVLVIFVLVFLFSLLRNTAEARETNAELLAFQRLHESP